METVEYKGYSIRIWNEKYPMDPRKEWDNLGTMFCFHHGRRYSLGDKHNYDLEEAMALEGRIPKSGGVVLPLYLYYHIGFIYAGCILCVCRNVHTPQTHKIHPPWINSPTSKNGSSIKL